MTYAREWKQQIGYEEHEISDDFEEWRSRVYPDDLESTLNRVNQSIAEGNPNHRTEFRFRHKDGSYRWILAQASILQDNHGNPVRMLGAHVDITERRRVEDELSQIFTMSLDMVCIADLNTASFLKVNPAFTQTLGFTEKELLKKPFLDFIHPEDVDSTHSVIEEKLKKGEKVINFENRYSHKDGSYRWLSWVSHPKPEAGVTYAVARDVTEWKQKEESLKKTKAILDAAGRMAKIGGWELDANTMEVTWTDETYRIHEVSPGYKPVLKEAINYFHPEERPKLEQAIKRALDHGEAYDMEIRFITANGKQLWTRTICQPEIEEGKTVKLKGIFQDITSRKLAEEALLESEERFRELVEMLPEAVFEADVDMNLTFANHRALTLFGYSEQDFKTGLNGFDMLVPKHRESALNRIKRRLRGEDLLASEYSGLKKDGTTFPILLHAVPILQGGKIRGVQGVIVDLSEIKKLESQLQQAHKMEAIGTLAGGIAHEFNNVLAIIMGNADLAIDDVPDWNPAREYLKEIRNASFRAKEVVRQILSFARKTMAALKPLEVNTIVKESLKLMRASIPAMISIKPKIPPGPKLILGDPTEIHQIVINLCTNAAHAMKTSGGILEVAVSEVTLDDRTASRYEDLSAGDFVKLTVKDSGEGIAPDVLEKVFEPYFTTKEFGQGSGMGLAVVYGIVKKCQGAINISSVVGEGTTVNVLFPKIEEEAPAKENKELALPRGNERILLVDDDPSIANMIRQMLERFGYTVTSMTESTTALERFKSDPDDFDLVVTDMSMPKMSGDQLAAELMKIRKNVPILLCTGHSDAVDEKKARQIGIKGFAMKPLDKGKLAKAVRATLDG